MRKKINIILLTVSLFLCVYGGYLFGVHSKEEEYYELYHLYDSLAELYYIRVDAELPYYGMEEDYVLSLLPEPSQVSDTMRLRDTTEVETHGIYNKYIERLSGTTDEIKVKTYYWTFPDKDSSRLYIVFELVDDSVWIANSCLQWKSNLMYLD